MIARLFQEIKEVLTRNVFEKQKEVRGGVEGTVKGDDIRVGG